jgi:hypothetical protein
MSAGQGVVGQPQTLGSTMAALPPPATPGLGAGLEPERLIVTCEYRGDFAHPVDEVPGRWLARTGDDIAPPQFRSRRRSFSGTIGYGAIHIGDGAPSSVAGDEDVMLSWLRRSGREDAEPARVYIYTVGYEHDSTYVENVVQYLESAGALCRGITLRADGFRPELQLCIDDRATAVLGFNSTLDHSWLASGSFLAAAEQNGIPVVQWILDHPSGRWHDFYASTVTNSRFLLNTEQERQYFQTYCLPGATTATIGGVGPNRRSRIWRLTRDAFMQRRVSCMIALSLHRVRSMVENDQAMSALPVRLADVARQAITRAQFDLIQPLHQHLVAALAAHNMKVPAPTFNGLCHIIEQSVQTTRRLKIFNAAREFRVLVQSDDSAKSYFEAADSILETNVSMQFTLARMPNCRSVLSVSPMNDMIHDRTMNALNGGCVAILEDNAASRSVFTHGKNALLFRYDDDSIEECLGLVCNQPERAYEIAQAGMALRDHPRLRFGQFHNILDLARRDITRGAKN